MFLLQACSKRYKTRLVVVKIKNLPANGRFFFGRSIIVLIGSNCFNILDVSVGSMNIRLHLWKIFCLYARRNLECEVADVIQSA